MVKVFEKSTRQLILAVSYFLATELSTPKLRILTKPVPAIPRLGELRFDALDGPGRKEGDTREVRQRFA